MSRLVVVAPLVAGMRSRAEELLREGPPFALDETQFDRHLVFLTEGEVVFLFEGRGETGTLNLPAESLDVLQAAKAWRECLAGRPRVAVTAYSWERPG